MSVRCVYRADGRISHSDESREIALLPGIDPCGLPRIEVFVRAEYLSFGKSDPGDRLQDTAYISDLGFLIFEIVFLQFERQFISVSADLHHG